LTPKTPDEGSAELDALDALAVRDVRRATGSWIETLEASNLRRVLDAFRCRRAAADMLQETSGYGYGDPARDCLERVFSLAFQAEAALVRPQIVSGTHALALCLQSLLRPGDVLLSACGRPYDTLLPVIGRDVPHPCSLAAWGTDYREVPLTPRGEVDVDGLTGALDGRVKVILIQRSRGYQERPALSLDAIGRCVELVRRTRPEAICLVDNAYGEFCAHGEPGGVGADLVAGSLIKNPGGMVAPGGGYVAGRADLVERVAARLTAPGLGAAVGPMLGQARLLWQGLFLAPHIVAEALRGAVYVASLFSRAGFAVDPGPLERRHDIVQAVTLGSPRRLLAFCRAIQGTSPVDSHVRPEAAPLPGYGDPVVMAAGTFVQGSSIELSADGPMRPPYNAYIQGGLWQHTRLAAQSALAAALADG